VPPICQEPGRPLEHSVHALSARCKDCLARSVNGQMNPSGPSCQMTERTFPFAARGGATSGNFPTWHLPAASNRADLPAPGSPVEPAPLSGVQRWPVQPRHYADLYDGLDGLPTTSSRPDVANIRRGAAKPPQAICPQRGRRDTPAFCQRDISVIFLPWTATLRRAQKTDGRQCHERIPPLSRDPVANFPRREDLLRALEPNRDCVNAAHPAPTLLSRLPVDRFTSAS
jgi:hypothetical protein